MRRVATTLLLLLFSAALLWGRDVNLINSSLVPAASGKVTTNAEPSGRADLRISVEHLPQPSSLSPPASAYVVWVHPPNMTPINVGELKVGNDLKATLTTSTQYQKFDVSVTAEQNSKATSPSGPEIMHGTVSQW
jgi:hypothetical protein